MTRFRPCLGSIALGILLLAGCGGKTAVESDLHIDGAPDWVNEGNQMLKDRDGISIARRTITKYRKAMSIPSSSQRREF